MTSFARSLPRPNPSAQLPTEVTMLPTMIAPIIDALRESQPLDPAYHHALERAGAYLHSGASYRFEGTTMLCTSEKGTERYHVTLTDCDCEAGRFHRICKHRAALTILIAAQTVIAASAAIAASPRASVQRGHVYTGRPHGTEPLPDPRGELASYQ